MPDYNFMQQMPQYPAGYGNQGSLVYGGNPYGSVGVPTFNPNMPAMPTYTPAVPHNLSPPANANLYDQLMQLGLTGGFLDPKNWMSDDWRGHVGKSLSENYLFPMLQYLQNQHQWLAEFNESQRREDAAQQWQRYTDTYGMELSKAQQQLNEWTAATAAEQWTKQHGFDVERFAKEFGLTEEQARHTMALESRKQEAQEQQWGQQFGLETRKQTAAEEQWAQEHGFEKEKWGQQYGLETSRLAQEKELAEKRLASEELQSRYAAFGRAQAPKVQWSRSW